MTLLQKIQNGSRRRYRQAEQSGQRLDIQGLRMVAVLTVFAAHLWGWPRGGFVGVDVFFVISGFLITGNLLRTAERTGNVSFRSFYWNRIRRIVPAATVVLILTYAASVVIFMPFRSQQVGIDALFAFVFAANWHFAVEGTDYFTVADGVSPVQHYWSLSIEEQFYFVWPAIIFLISVLVARKTWTHRHRMGLAGVVLAVIVAASFGWAVYETTTSPTWAYFSTFTRVWELGVGALLATAVGALGRIPGWAKPVLSWGGLVLIGASVFAISEDSTGFPAPWALLPVAGAAMVIAAGVRGEPRYQPFLRNPLSVYIGNISYSLYLVHWPVIVLVGSLVAGGSFLYLVALPLTAGLAVASYHFVETPLRRFEWVKFREGVQQIRDRTYEPHQPNGLIAMATVACLTFALCAYVLRPADTTQTPTAIAAAPGDSTAIQFDLGPLGSALQDEITQALSATEWPALDPTMEQALSGLESPPEVHACTDIDPLATDMCTWGSPSAPTRIVIVGDSVGLGYAGSLREIALNSDGQIQVHVTTMGGCQFANDAIFVADQDVQDSCPERKTRQIELINSTKPDIVIISNAYREKYAAANRQQFSDGDWHRSLIQIIEKFRTNTNNVVLLAAPPADKSIRECYSGRTSVPADCISQVDRTWRSIARIEQGVAESVGGTWIDSRPWFCNGEGLCPSFVGSTPTKLDAFHMTAAYGQKIYPVIGESFTGAGVF